MADEMNIVELFPMLTGELGKAFDQQAERMHFEKGSVLYEQGFPCPFVAFIISGIARVFKIGESGREITLYRIQPGQICILSSTCSISDKHFPAIAEVEEDVVTMVLPGRAFRDLVSRFFAMQKLINDTIADRLMEMMTVIDDVAFRRVDLRLAERLLRESLPPKSPDVDTTHARLAHELGSSREVISRILKEFERRGIVNLERGRVEILSRDALDKYRDLHQGGGSRGL